MYGVVTRSAEDVTWPEFEFGFYEVKDVTGRAADPSPEAISLLSCFGDNAAAEDNPDLVPVDDEGNLATKERPYFDWAYVCPTHDRYREGLLKMVEDAADVNENLRLDDVGFPREEYCYCERCRERFEASEYEDRFAWRASVITNFVAEARDRVPGDLYLTLYPDPYPGHVYERAGLDIEALEAHVDEFVVPLYDTEYATTYWLEILASGFADLLETDFAVELYAAGVDIDPLVKATEVVSEYADDVIFGYDSSTARATLRRMQADAREGESHGVE
jgi:hypothetical protein